MTAINKKGGDIGSDDGGWDDDGASTACDSIGSNRGSTGEVVILVIVVTVEKGEGGDGGGRSSRGRDGGNVMVKVVLGAIVVVEVAAVIVSWVLMVGMVMR